MIVFTVAKPAKQMGFSYVDSNRSVFIGGWGGKFYKNDLPRQDGIIKAEFEIWRAKCENIEEPFRPATAIKKKTVSVPKHVSITKNSSYNSSILRYGWTQFFDVEKTQNLFKKYDFIIQTCTIVDSSRNIDVHDELYSRTIRQIYQQWQREKF